MIILVIIIEDLTQSYDGKRNAIDNLSLKIDQNQVFSFLGPNGSGKTTLINILCGLLKRNSGKVDVGGFDPEKEPNQIRKMVGLVPQETALYDYLTAKENLEFHARFYGVPRSNRNTRIDDALELAQLTDRANDRVNTFSGGMKRRLALVRALIHDPNILILDEPTLGVDVQSRNEIWNRINELKQDKTIILCTNYMDEADRLADQCAIIDHGKLIVLDRPENLKIKYAGGVLLEAQIAVSKDMQNQLYNQLYEKYTSIKITQLEIDDHYLVSLPANVEANQLLTEFSQTIQTFSDLSLINLNVRTPTLDDVFLELTGTKLRE